MHTGESHQISRRSELSTKPAGAMGGADDGSDLDPAALDIKEERGEDDDDLDQADEWQYNSKFMCNLPISEAKAIELHQIVKNGIRQMNKRLKVNNLK